MVSGLVTSPCDQLRIFSGEARLMRIASKSAITFAISNGLERNKGFLRFLRSCATASGSPNQFLVPDSPCSVEPVELLPSMRHGELMPQWRMFQKSSLVVGSRSAVGDVASYVSPTMTRLICGSAGRGLLFG